MTTDNILLKRTELIKLENDRYKRVNDILTRGISGCHFKHIMNNLLTVLVAYEFYDKMNDDPELWTREKHRYFKVLRLTKEYLRLIEEFPDFRRDEFREKPIEYRLREIRTKLSPTEFVMHAYEALRAEQLTYSLN